MSEVLVTGGTGRLGREVVAGLLARGHGVRVLSRRGAAPSGEARGVRGDLASGVGLRDAAAAVDAIVHCATAADTRSLRRLRAVDVAGTRRLVEAAADAGSPHFVYVSIVGIDDDPFPYYKAKREAELEVERSSLPWTILRATQFHELVRGMLGVLARPPVALVPRGFRVQPVAPREVGERLVELLEGAPRGRTEIGGPEVLTAEELMRGYLAAAGRQRPMLSVPLAGRTARAFRTGAHTCLGCARGQVTWERFLAGES